MISDYESGGSAISSYNVRVVFEGANWSIDLQEAFVTAADYISSLITADIRDVYSDFGDGQGARWIDDLEITAKLDSIDGVNGVLGQAGPTVLRNSTSLPVLGEMTFDIADAQDLYDDDIVNGTTRWNDVVLHEMLHTLGVGSLWAHMGLVQNIGTTANPDYRYTGQNGKFEYEHEFAGVYANDANSAFGVPVESHSGSSGTDGSHWDEVLFDGELMTGYLDGNNYISNMTIASIQDLGYTTVYAPSCFCKGTLIETDQGYKSIESLQAGDLIWTLDRGYQPIRLITLSTYSVPHMNAHERHRPIRIKPGALGQECGFPPLYLSPQHRIYVAGQTVIERIGEVSALLPIKDSTDLAGIRRILPKEEVDYFHLVLPHHNIIRANGVLCESYLAASMMPARKCLKGPLAVKIMRKLRQSKHAMNGLMAQDPFLEASIAIMP